MPHVKNEGSIEYLGFQFRELPVLPEGHEKILSNGEFWIGPVNDEAVVEVHVGIRVESVHFQNGSVTAELLFVYDKRCAIHPVFVLHPLHGFLVHAVERIRYSVMVQQILVHGSGHLGVAP